VISKNPNDRGQHHDNGSRETRIFAHGFRRTEKIKSEKETSRDQWVPILSAANLERLDEALASLHLTPRRRWWAKGPPATRRARAAASPSGRPLAVDSCCSVGNGGAKVSEEEVKNTRCPLACREQVQRSERTGRMVTPRACVARPCARVLVCYWGGGGHADGDGPSGGCRINFSVQPINGSGSKVRLADAWRWGRE
jgi:hypothetical protein